MLYPIQNAARNRLDLSGIWDFRADPDAIGEQAGWAHGFDNARPIAVPGSWNEQYADLFNYLGLAWYVQRSYIPAGWRGQRIFIRVGSACYFGTVYINGERVGSHAGGHLPFAFEITHLVRWDTENVIAISVEDELQPTRVPSGNIPSPIGGFASNLRTTYDFFPFAGLHRPVVLYSVPQTYIDDLTVVSTINGNDGMLHVTVQLNSTDTIQGALQLHGNGATISTQLHFLDGMARAELIVPAARLWSDTDPYLYTLRVGVAGDQYDLPVGIRTISVEGHQILLNGKPVQLNGYGRHEDFIASGKGLNLPLLVKDYQLMRWTGANAYRTSHYPYSEEEMQLADREGFLIIDETPAVSLQFDTDENIAARLQVCLQQIDELIARDKNHPSVAMWCVANEPMPRNFGVGAIGGKPVDDPSAAQGKAMLDTMLARARTLDTTRPVTLVTIMGGPRSWMEQCDVICMNRYWGWYALGGQLDQARAGLEQELDEVWQTFGKPIIMTEFGADTMAGMHGHPSVMWTEEYQAEYIRFHLEVAAARDFVAGMQVWNFADFAAVQSIMRVGGLNMKGVFTRTRQPKMAAHVLREFWVKT
ncbi:MAG TPA: beta-glucuronidase [Roseiflexaceae bacterium]|nr:beta-glucuronidase [Roseiflexaceae bacterium]